MALKYKYTAKEEIPPAHAAAYVERDGAWCLDVEGAVEESQLDKVLAHSAKLEKERDHLNARLTTLQIDEGAVAAASRRGLRPTAAPDLAARARASLGMVDGVAVVLDEDRKTPRKGKDGKKPMSVDEWVENLTAEAPHLFEANSGSGAAGNPAPASAAMAAGMVNPYKEGKSWNLTEQSRLETSNPELAAQLEAAVT